MSKKKNVITFRLSDEEFEPFIKAMDILKNQNRSEFFRDLVVSNFDLNEVDKRKTEYYKGLLFYFNKASNNINQVAKRIHQESLKGGGDLRTETLNAILGSLNRLNENFKTGIEEFKNEIKK